MKNIFTKNNFMKKLLCAILFSVILASSLTVFASAGEKPAKYDEPIEWSLSGDGKKLTASTDKVYYRYELAIDAEMNPWSIYYFVNTVRVNSGQTASVRSYDRYGEIVWLQTSGDPIIYVTDVGRQILDGFADGTGRAYYLELDENYSSVYYTRIEASFAKELRNAYINGENRYTFDVRELQDYIRYDVQFGDSQDIFCCEEGYIFIIAGDFYYVHFDSLDNTHFDADGNFSFRSGEVELMKLEGEMRDTVADANFDPRHRTSNFETDDNNSEMPMALFWIPYVFVGFVLPLPFLALGLIFANVKKRSKHWYAVAISAGVWILIAAILMIVLIV